MEGNVGTSCMRRIFNKRAWLGCNGMEGNVGTSSIQIIYNCLLLGSSFDN